MWLFIQHEIRKNSFLLMSFGTFQVFKEENEFYFSWEKNHFKWPLPCLNPLENVLSL